MGGRIVGFIEIANTYQIEVVTETIEALKDKMQIIENSSNPLIEGVFQNFILELF